MNKEIIDWLLKGPPWINYAVELQILGAKPDVKPVLKAPVISDIVSRLKEPKRGIPSIQSGNMNADEYENPYWDLFFLADIGLSAADLQINNEINGFLVSQLENGSYTTEFGMEQTYFCKSAILLSDIARMGYKNDPHLKKYIQLLLSLQRLDSGWYCNPNHNIGNTLQYEPSCPQDNLNILLLLGQYEEYRNNPRFNGAIDLLLRHWEMRDTGARIVYFGVGRRFQSLRYPAARYGILRVLDALSLFPYAIKHQSFQNMLEFVYKKARDGKYYVELPSPYTNLEPQREPSRLITFVVSRIDKRVREIK